MLRLNNMFLEIICYNKSTIASLPDIGIRHFALGVSDIEKGKKFVTSNNICTNIDVKVGKLGKPYFFITDPDGIQVEIIEE